MPPIAVRDPSVPTWPRNDPRQYDDLVADWWDPRGAFAMLHAIATARASLIPAARTPDAVLVDLACGGGLMAPHVQRLGYRHLGLDLTHSALREATAHGVTAVRADILAVPLADGVADVVSAGEILEHVTDLPRAVAEACRVLKPGGLLVIDTLADTAVCALLAVHLAERIPGGAPKGIHDPALFVDREELRRLAEEHGVTLQLNGIRPSVLNLVRWFTRRTDEMKLVTTRSTAVLFQAHGRKLVA